MAIAQSNVSSSSPGHRREMWLIVLTCLCAAASAHAQLSWTSKRLELTSDSSAPTVEGSFHFVNSGSKPVDISRVATSCGCTSANLVKRHFDPGQGGDIIITYSRGSHTGLMKNYFDVEADGQPPTMLELWVHIPEVLRLDPAFVTWTHTEPKTPKTIALKLVAPGRITAIDIQSSAPEVAAQANELVPGEEYRLVISPQDVHHFLRAVLNITCEVDGKEKKTFTSYATVQPATSP